MVLSDAEQATPLVQVGEVVAPDVGAPGEGGVPLDALDGERGDGDGDERRPGREDGEGESSLRAVGKGASAEPEPERIGADRREDRTVLSAR